MRFTRFLIYAGIAFCGFYLTRTILVRAQSEASVNVPPYVMTQTDFVIQNGKELDTVNTTAERLGDGSTNSLQTHLLGVEAGKTYRRIERSDGLEGMILDGLQVKSTGHMTPKQLAVKKASLLSPPVNCLNRNETIVAKTSLLGMNAIEVVRTNPPTAGQQPLRELSWRLPSFSCLTVQMFVQRPDSAGQWQTTLGKRLDSFHAEAPPLSDFSGWASYTEMRPSDAKRAMSKDDGIIKSQCPKCYEDDTVSDKGYAAAQNNN